MMQYGRGQHLVCEERHFIVVATIASILRHAGRMSFRNDGSCRIDDTRIFENLGTYLRLQLPFGYQIDSAASEDRQLLDE